MLYCLVIKIYADRTKDVNTVGNWADLIQQAIGASKLANLVWTRHSSTAGVVNHMDFYSDMFNEGIIVLASTDKIKAFQ